jgi:trehalose 6-phosphate synthase
VAVSNRVADFRKAAQSGGLAVGLVDAFKSRGGLWFGWDGETVHAAADIEPKTNKTGNVTTVTMPMTEEDYAEYYLGFSNSVLWPLLHYRLDLVQFEPGFLEGYRRVNARFADALLPFLRPDDLLWVHDYHLIPFAAELRKRDCRQRIGFFLHIPFPPPEILAAAPQHEWLADSLFQYDVIGFQTDTDLGNFLHYVEDHVRAEALDGRRIRIGGRTVVAGSFPVGIDVDSFAEMAAQMDEDVQIDMMRRRILGRQQIIGVDRLDYSKGLPDRLRAFRRLLELYPEHLKKVTFMQIAPPTREDVDAYADIREELEGLSGSINGGFGDFNWVPIHYIHRSIEREKLASLFRASQVGFVTPLRDGMNLVAKEFVAAQDEEDPGVLVLSKFAGAAEDLEEALIVNPYDVDDMAENLQRALTMPLAERQERQQALLQQVRENDAQKWQEDFLAELEGETQEPPAGPTKT